jgi:hypothetical protein
MDTSLITAVVLVALIGAVLLTTVRLLRSDRPARPPRTFDDDWRDRAVSWHHLGIR